MRFKVLVIGTMVSLWAIYDLVLSPAEIELTDLLTASGQIEKVNCHKENLDGLKLSGYTNEFSTFHMPRTSCEQGKSIFKQGMVLEVRYPANGKSAYVISSNEKVYLSYEQALQSRKDSKLILYFMAFLFMGCVAFLLFRAKKHNKNIKERPTG